MMIRNNQMYKEGDKNMQRYNSNTRRSNVPSSISSKGSSFEEYPTSQKIGYFTDDETIDARAASYISYVQERFKLERVM